MAICNRDWHFKLDKEKESVSSFLYQTNRQQYKEKAKGATDHKTLRESFSEGVREASSTLLSTNLAAETL